jgi:Glycosyl hydrolase catalytic core
MQFTKPGSKISWLYNWSPNPSPAPALNFVPMQWNHVDAASLARKVQECHATALLGFNEPELPDQANMPVELAANEWLQHIEPLRRSGIRCGSPGISSAPHGMQWLKQFLYIIRAQGGDIDFYAFHWYGETLGQFYDYIWSTHHQLGPDRPVWITEFAPTNWNQGAPLPKEHVENFVAEACKYLDTLDWVERYAFFGAMRDTGNVGQWAAMIDSQGNLTNVGRIYRDT